MVILNPDLPRPVANRVRSGFQITFVVGSTGLNNVCACASCQGASDCARPKYHNNPYENGGVFKNSRVDPGILLRWLTRVFLRLDSARYHRLPNVSINRAFTNDASNPKKKGNHLKRFYYLFDRLGANTPNYRARDTLV